MAPFVGIGLFAIGVGLICFALPRMRRQEEDEQERGSMERQKLRRELDLETQSGAEKMAKLVKDQQEVEGPPDCSVPRDRTVVSREWLRNAAAVEALVLARLAEIAPPLYELRPRVRMPGPPVLLLDALLISSIDQLQDIVVEIKVGGPSSGLRQRLLRAMSLLDGYRGRADRGAMAWVIVVVEGSVTSALRNRLEQDASEAGQRVHLTIVEEADIDHLLLPAS